MPTRISIMNHLDCIHIASSINVLFCCWEITGNLLEWLQANLQQSCSTTESHWTDLKPALLRFGQLSCKEGSNIHPRCCANRVKVSCRSTLRQLPRKKPRWGKARRFPHAGVGVMLQQPGRLLIYFSQRQHYNKGSSFFTCGHCPSLKLSEVNNCIIC